MLLLFAALLLVVTTAEEECRINEWICGQVAGQRAEYATFCDCQPFKDEHDCNQQEQCVWFHSSSDVAGCLHKSHIRMAIGFYEEFVTLESAKRYAKTACLYEGCPSETECNECIFELFHKQEVPTKTREPSFWMLRWIPTMIIILEVCNYAFDRNYSLLIRSVQIAFIFGAIYNI